MATPLADLLFAIIALAIIVAQLLILRSTARALRQATAPRRTVLEWAYALIPAAALIVALVLSWQVMHPRTVEVEGVAPAAERRS